MVIKHMIRSGPEDKGLTNKEQHGKGQENWAARIRPLAQATQDSIRNNKGTNTN
jgi:hypothetical protein